MKKIRFDSLSKNELSKFNQAEIQGWIVDQFIQIEHRIDDVIIKYFKPENESIFRSILLNSSILPTGGKLKVLINIGISNSTIEKLRKLSSIRNAFAHTRIGEHVTIMISEDETELKNIEIETESILEVMQSSGKLVSKNAFNYAEEFLKLRNEIRKEI